MSFKAKLDALLFHSRAGTTRLVYIYSLSVLGRFYFSIISLPFHIMTLYFEGTAALLEKFYVVTLSEVDTSSILNCVSGSSVIRRQLLNSWQSLKLRWVLVILYGLTFDGLSGFRFDFWGFIIFECLRQSSFGKWMQL